jgi:hypothetical protein
MGAEWPGKPDRRAGVQAHRAAAYPGAGEGEPVSQRRQGRRLTGLAPWLDEAQRNILIEEAIVAANSPYAEWRVFASLSPVVGAERYDRVLASASALYRPDDRVRALSMLLPNAPDPVRVRSMIRRALIKHILGLEQWPSLLMSELRSRWLSELGHHEGVLAALQAHLSELQEQWVWH